MDFITGLLRTSKHHDSIMVMVNKLKKVAHFKTIKSTYLASEVAQVFIRDIVRLHGFPKKIVSDKDAKFTSRFLEGVICRFGYRVGFQYNLSSTNKWTDK